MSDQSGTKRLSQVLKEVNVGFDNLKDFLVRKGYQVENPNTKIPDEAYQLILKEFHHELIVKQESLKVNLAHKQDGLESDAPKATPEVVEPKPEPKKEKEVAISSPQESIPVEKEIAEVKPTKGPKILGKMVLEEPKSKKTSDTKAKKSVPETEVPVAEEKVAPEKVIEEAPIVETPKIEEVVLDPVEIEKPKIAGPVIIGKMELKEEKPKEKSKPKTIKKANKQTQEPLVPEQKEEIKPIDIEEKPIELVSPLEENPIVSLPEELVIVNPEEVSVVLDAIVEPDDNFMKTKVEKLSGPKVVGSIDLAQFKKPEKKPVASSNEDKDKLKKKRKRILKDTPKPAPQQNQAPQTPKQPRTSDKKLVKKADIKNEPNPEEIQRQIKETLARLQGTNKSGGSKYRRQKRDLHSQHKMEQMEQDERDKSILKVTEFLTANELAIMMNVPVTKIIGACMSLGLFVSINQRLDAETIVLVANEFGYEVSFVSVEDQAEVSTEEDDPDTLVPRAPVVTVMGHVDHGKTSLLDYIRKTNVIAGEAGGITQHIGAYEVKLEDGRRITFLDTPGHEAFTAMRARGAKITDVAIIVIAADDQVMPQTIEAINHAKAAGVPMVFAISKIDKAGANPEKIKEQLAGMNLLVEDWGGKFQSQEIDAKHGLNLDKLLEKVLLEAELLELKANPDKLAVGSVIESTLDKGRGYMTTMLVHAGTLRIGDIVLAGMNYGRVKAIFNERNQPIKEAGPSTPVLMLGLNGAAQAGDKFNVFVDEREAKDLALKRQQLIREQSLRTQKHITLDEIGRRIAIGDFKELNIIVKADVDGSVEALSDSLLKLSKENIQVNVIHKAVGQITESDILLASASNAIIIGFQVRPSLGARKLAEHEEIDVRTYSVIYDAIEEVKSAIEGMLTPKVEEKIVCNIEVREVFKITKVGTIAGCMVLDGKMNRNHKVRLIRDGIVIYTGVLDSLKRFKDDVKEVVSGQECGLNIKNFNDIKTGDIVEAFEEFEVLRK